ncbi:MAG: hypothetical protein ACTSQP_24260 [Promethearchaeota archaeon]
MIKVKKDIKSKIKSKLYYLLFFIGFLFLVVTYVYSPDSVSILDSHPISYIFGGLAFIVIFIGVYLYIIEQKKISEQKVRKNKEFIEKKKQEEQKEREKKIKQLILKGFTNVNYSLGREDYTNEFLNIMKNWEKIDFTKKNFPLSPNESSLFSAEKEIEKMLNDYFKVTAHFISGQVDAVSEIYTLVLKIGRYNPLDPLLWKQSYLIIGEIITSNKASSDVIWINDRGHPVTLREIKDRPLKIKEKFFEFHIGYKQFW